MTTAQAQAVTNDLVTNNIPFAITLQADGSWSISIMGISIDAATVNNFAVNHGVKNQVHSVQLF